MQYQVWDGYYPGSGYAFAESQTGLPDELVDNILFGEALSPPFPAIRILKIAAGVIPDHLTTGWGPNLVSQILKDILTAYAAEDIQFIPVSIPAYPERQFYIPNPLQIRSCLDLAASVYEAFSDPPHAIYSISKMVLLPLSDDTPALFKVEELADVILVRDDLRERMQAMSAAPGTFTPIGDYSH